MKKILIFIVLAGLFFCGGVEAAKLEPLFMARNWTEIDKLAKQGGLTPQDRSLAANAYRLQGRWSDVVGALGNVDDFPPSVAPYAKMVLLVAFENLGRNGEALKLADDLRKNSPTGLGFYASYAVYRLSKDANVRLAALKEMSSKATEKPQTAYALEELIKSGQGRVENAKKLLELDPSNSIAVKVLSDMPKPWSADNAMLLGHAAYLVKDNKRAAEILSTVPNNRKAQYYRAMALYGDKNYSAALNLLAPLALSGNGFALNAATRISIISNRNDATPEVKGQAKEALRRIAESRKGMVQARALYSLGMHDRVLMEYPSSSFALKVVWEKGMNAWNAGNATEALWYWQRANMPDMPTTWGARVLYWTAKAQQKLGQGEGATKTLNSLTSRYPLSIYTYMAKPGALKIVNNEPPALVSQPTELERWGFMNYARMNLLRESKDPKKAYRAAKISEWLSDDGSLYRAGISLQRFFVKGMTASRQGLQLTHPRPYLNSVRKASEKFGIEENFVWAIMKQESAFNPLVKSHAGATGLMQLMPATAKGEAGLAKMQDFKIWDVEDNIALGTSYLSRQLRAFGNPQRAAAAYNAGPGNAKRWNAGAEKLPIDLWIERITFDETNDYVQRVMSNLMTYRLLYGEKNSPVMGMDPIAPDDEEIEAQRAATFAGSFNDVISALREP